jgi:nitrogen-specific signal transduction histidine kinase
MLGRSGTGLGLTIVWNAVQEHGGKISVKSSTEGTCFSLYFPVRGIKSNGRGMEEDTEVDPAGGNTSWS